MSINAVAADVVTMAIDSQEAFDSWTYIDANKDGKTWYYDASVGGARYDYHSSNQAEDWLISPSVFLEAGKIYEISGYVQIPKSMTETFMFTIGRGVTADSQSTVILPEQSASSVSSYRAYTATYAPEETGEYNIAIKATTPKNRYYIYFQKFEVVEKVELPGNVTDLKAVAGDAGALKTTLTWKWPVTNSDGYELKSGVTGARIYRTNSSWVSVGENILIANVDAPDAVPGEEYMFVDNEVPAKDNYYYYVKVIGENGDQPGYASAGKVWIGPDELTSISSLKAAVSDDFTSVSLTWEGPAKNGGYVDMTGAGYEITRTSGSTGEVTVLEENWQGASPYVDSNVLYRDNYKYSVKFTHPELTSSSAQTVKAMAGVKATMPYSNNLTYSYYSDNNGADLVSTFHVNGTRDWSKDSSGMYIYYSGTDAWFATPSLDLEAGKLYEVTFDTKVGNSYYSRDLGVYLDVKADKDNLPVRCLSTETISSTTLTTKTLYVTVDETGEYCLAFNGKATSGTSTSYSLYVRNLNVKEIQIVPAAVSDLTATPAGQGALSAHLTWINPSVDNTGAELTAIDRVEVRRGDAVVKTFPNPAPGVAVEYDDVVEAAGEYTYAVTAWLGDNSGEATETTLWVGDDTPKAPVAVAVAVADGVPTITWTVETEGVHGGYVNFDAVDYTVTRNDAAVATGLTSTEWTDADGPTLDLARYTYAVAARLGDYTSEYTAADAVTLGAALSLPYLPDFTDKNEFDLWTCDGWSHNSNQLRASKTESWAFTPPFVALDGTLSLEFDHQAYSGRYPMKLYVYLAEDTQADADRHVLLRDESNDCDYFLHESSWGSNKVTLSVPVTDKIYHIGLRAVDNSMYGYLNGLKIYQDTTTGIDSIGVDDVTIGGDTRYYTLQGMEVSGNIAPGLYVVKNGTATRKVLVK